MPFDTYDDITIFQATLLGRTSYPSANNYANCLLELLPFPTYDWLGFPSLDAFVNRIGPTRAMHIGEKIAQHKPEVVQFYGSSNPFRPFWEWIVKELDGEISSQAVIVAGKRAYFGKNRDTQFAITNHPAAPIGTPTEYWHDVGKFIADRLAGFHRPGQ